MLEHVASSGPSRSSITGSPLLLQSVRDGHVDHVDGARSRPVALNAMWAMIAHPEAAGAAGRSSRGRAEHEQPGILDRPEVDERRNQRGDRRARRGTSLKRAHERPLQQTAVQRAPRRSARRRTPSARAATIQPPWPGRRGPWRSLQTCRRLNVSGQIAPAASREADEDELGEHADRHAEEVDGLEAQPVVVDETARCRPGRDAIVIATSEASRPHQERRRRQRHPDRRVADVVVAGAPNTSAAEQIAAEPGPSHANSATGTAIGAHRRLERDASGSVGDDTTGEASRRFPARRAGRPGERSASSAGAVDGRGG